MPIISGNGSPSIRFFDRKPKVCAEPCIFQPDAKNENFVNYCFTALRSRLQRQKSSSEETL